MNYRAYPKSKDTPARMTRKQSRRRVFLENKKMAKIARKTRAELKQVENEI